MHAAESAASKDRVNTIKPRHLSAVTVAPAEASEEGEHQAVEIEEDVLDGQISGSALTPSVVRKMSRAFAGMSVTDAAIEELLLLVLRGSRRGWTKYQRTRSVGR